MIMIYDQLYSIKTKKKTNTKQRLYNVKIYMYINKNMEFEQAIHI